VTPKRSPRAPHITGAASPLLVLVLSSCPRLVSFPKTSYLPSPLRRSSIAIPHNNTYCSKIHAQPSRLHPRPHLTSVPRICLSRFPFCSTFLVLIHLDPPFLSLFLTRISFVLLPTSILRSGSPFVTHAREFPPRFNDKVAFLTRSLPA
jgi:hypothetical protein